ncbi:hypothetical protein [Pseudomonas sp. Irchel s3b6]|uniref:hypothetical protein n=1 Tax=Pseudomonas sp. Irchel s3b6 TaxID=2009078 RepID=UPI0011405484|nr:hypothetical protein [Pseudomonas sp. Irchel s3b6]
MTSTTMGSSMPDMQQLRRRLPPDLYQRNNALLDELEWSRVELQRLQAQQPAPDPDKATAMKARALHAGATKTSRKHDAIDAGVELYRLQLVNWTGTDTARAIWLTKRIYPDGKTDRAGKPCGWRTVYNQLKTLLL